MVASSGGAVGICNSAATSPGPCCKRWSNAGVACNAWAALEEDADESSFHTLQGNQHIPPIWWEVRKNHGKSKVPGDSKGYA